MTTSSVVRPHRELKNSSAAANTSAFPSIVVETNFSVVAPAGTPGAIVQRMNAEINQAMRSSPLAEKLAMHAFIPSFDTPEEFAAKLARDRAFWAAFIRRADIKPE